MQHHCIEDKNDLEKEESSEQECGKIPVLASDIMGNQEESNGLSDIIKVDLTYNTIKDKYELKKEESNEQESEKSSVPASDIMENSISDKIKIEIPPLSDYDDEVDELKYKQQILGPVKDITS